MKLSGFRETRAWPWVASSLLVIAALAMAYGYRGCFEPVANGAAPVSAPVRVQAPSEPAAPDWRPSPAVVRDGWLAASRQSDEPFFNVTNSAIDLGEVTEMAPAVGDIPAIDRPAFVPVASVSWLEPEDEVIALDFAGESRCYPLAILRWHQVVDDVIAGRAVAIVFDPLSGATVGLRRVVDDAPIVLEVSGKAYRGIGLLYDREERNLWHPLRRGCVAGKRAGKARLQPVLVQRTTWAAWKRGHESGQVLSRNTGHDRPYDVDPYASAPIGPNAGPVNYWDDPELLLAPLPEAIDLAPIGPKRMVLGLVRGDEALAVVAPEQWPQRASRFDVDLGGRRLRGVCDGRTQRRQLAVELEGEEGIAQLTCYWFAWKASYPNTAVQELR